MILALLQVSVAQFPPFTMTPEIEELLNTAMQGNPFAGGQNSLMPKPFDLMSPTNLDHEMMRFVASSNQVNMGPNELPRRGNSFSNHQFARPIAEMEPSDMFMLLNVMKSQHSPFANHGHRQNHHFTPEIQQPAFPPQFNGQQQQFPPQFNDQQLQFPPQFQEQNPQTVTESVYPPQSPNNMVMETTTNPRFKGMQVMKERNNINNAKGRFPNEPSTDMAAFSGGVVNEPINSQMGTNNHMDHFQSGQTSFREPLPADLPISNPSSPLSSAVDLANIFNPSSVLGGLPIMRPGHPGVPQISLSDMFELMENRMEHQLRTRQIQAMMAAFNKPQARHHNQQNTATDSFVNHSPVIEQTGGNVLQEPAMPSNIIETANPNIQPQQQARSANSNTFATLSEQNRMPSVTSLITKSAHNPGVDTGAAPAGMPGAPATASTNERMCLMCFNMLDSGPCRQQFCANP